MVFLDDISWEIIASNKLFSNDAFKKIKKDYIFLDVVKCNYGQESEYFFAGHLFNKNQYVDTFVGNNIAIIVNQVFSEYAYLFSDKIKIGKIIESKLNILNKYMDCNIVIVDGSSENINFSDNKYSNICYVGEYTTVGRLLKSSLEEDNKLLFRLKSNNNNFDIIVLNDFHDKNYDIKNIPFSNVEKTIYDVIQKNLIHKS